MDQITKLIMEQETLRSRTLKGTFWSAADAFLGQGVSFLVGIVLARLLSPDEYGLIGICLIFTTVLNGIVDSGFSSALIRKKEVSQTDYNTMFFTNLATSGVLYLFLFFCAPFLRSIRIDPVGQSHGMRAVPQRFVNHAVHGSHKEAGFQDQDQGISCIRCR